MTTKVSVTDLFAVLDKYSNKIVEVPNGSNLTIFGIRYGWNGVPWCNIYISEVGKECSGSYDWLGRYSYTVFCAMWWQKQNKWANWDQPRPGYIVFFDWDGSKSTSKIDHIGVVRAVYSNGFIKVSHGNYNNMCTETIFDPAKVVVGYGVPTFYTPPAPPPKPSPPRLSLYTVKKGDTLSSIASRYKMTLADLAKVNPQIKNLNLIYPGQKVWVKALPPVIIKTVTVKRGDNLSVIAEREGTTVLRILQLNPGIKNANLIYPNQRIRVK